MPDSLPDTIDANSLRVGEEHFLEKLDCISSILKVALNCSGKSREKCNIQDVVVALKKIKIQLQPYMGICYLIQNYAKQSPNTLFCSDAIYYLVFLV